MIVTLRFEASRPHVLAEYDHQSFNDFLSLVRGEYLRAAPGFQRALLQVYDPRLGRARQNAETTTELALHRGVHHNHRACQKSGTAACTCWRLRSVRISELLLRLQKGDPVHPFQRITAAQFFVALIPR